MVLGCPAKRSGVFAASPGWFDPGSATVKTVQALGIVALICAVAIGLILMVLGGIRSWQAWVRRTVNRRGVLGLILVLAGWLLIYVAMALSLTLYRYLSLPFVGLALILFCAGIVMAVLGLGQIRRHPKWFNYGRGHAVAAIWGGTAPLIMTAVIAAAAVWTYRADLGMMRLMARGYHDSGSFGYRVNLSGSLWRTWREADGRLTGADFGVVGLMGNRGLFVLPVPLPERKGFDMDAVVEAMLGEVERKPGEPKLESVPAPAGAVADERQYEIFLQREKLGVAHRYRVAVDGGVAYLVGAWMDQRLGASRERLDDEVMRVFLGGGPRPRSENSGGADGALSARVFRRVAANLSRRGMSAEAAAWNAEAQRLDGLAGTAVEAKGGADALPKAIFALDVGDGEKALELAGSAGAANSTNHAAVAVKALALAAVGKLSEGLRLAESSAAGAPDAIALGAAVDYLRSLKTKDVGSALNVPIEAVPVPNDLLKAEKQKGDGEAEGASYDWAITAMRFRRAEPLVTTRYGRVTILSEKGKKAFPAVIEDFDPNLELPHFHRAAVLDAGGREIAKIGPAALRVQAIENRRARFHATLPELQPGQAVEWAVTFRRNAPSMLVPFVSHCFSRNLPVRKSVLWVDGDFRSVTASSSTGVPRPMSQPRPHWVVPDPPARPASEPYLPPDEVYLPHVWFSEVRGDWQRVAIDYMALARERQRPDSNLAAIAEKIAAGADATEGKVAALSRLVQVQLRATPSRYGIGRRLPDRASEILAAREGDSVAHAALLNALLDAAGVNSSLALVCAGGLFHEGIPSLDQFNQMLVFVPGIPQQFVDCYQKERDPIGALPARLAARRALVLDAKEPKVLDVPSMPAVASIELKRRAHLGAEDITIEEEARVSGAMPTILAERIGWADGSIASAKTFIGAAKGVEVKSLDVTPDTAKGITRIKISARARKQGLARIPALFETLMLELGPAADRRGPAWMGSPVVLNGSLEVSDDTGSITVVSSGAQLVGRRLAGCAFKEKQGYSYTLERVPGLMSGENFQRLAAEAREIIAAIEPQIPGAGASK